MKYLSSIIGITATMLFVLSACSERNEDNAQQPQPTTVTAKAFRLQKMRPEKKIIFPAELLPLERAEVFARVNGYIKSLPVDIGDRVQKGQVLLTMEAPEMIANYEKAKADVQTAHSTYLGSRDNYRRLEHAARVPGTVAAGELESARSRMLADSAALDATRSSLQALAALKDYLVIRAPFSGTITQRNVDPGTLVGPSNARPLLLVENNAMLRVRVPVPEAFSLSGDPSGSLQFTVDALPGTAFSAKLSRKSGSLDQQSRTETWEYLFANKGNQLKPGMIANASLELSRSDSSFFVPATAIATTLERKFVIRLHNGVTEWVDVRSGLLTEGKAEIFANLKEGDTLLMRATDEIKEGVKLQPVFEVKSE